MNRYDHDALRSRDSNSRSAGQGRDPFGARPSRPRGGYDREVRASGRRGAGYDAGYRGPNVQPDVYRGRRGDLRAGDRTLWGTEPGRELTRGYSDFSPRGRFGGYYGAWDLRPMMAGYDAEMSAGQRRGRTGRGR